MSNSVKKVLLAVILLLVGWWAVSKLVAIALALVFKLAIPVLVIGGIGYVAYRAFGGNKAIGGGRRTLP